MNWYKKTLKSESEYGNISSMSKELIIMRGTPSSGKSFLAKQLSGDTGSVFSADNYHIEPATGKYNWKPENVKKAHQWNHDRVKEAILQGISPVIIDNTHTRKWELLQLKPLVELAENNGYGVRIEEPNPEWYHWNTAFDADALYERNKKTHNVPYETIKKMVNNYDKDVTIEDIKNEFKPKEVAE